MIVTGQMFHTWRGLDDDEKKCDMEEDIYGGGDGGAGSSMSEIIHMAIGHLG